MCKLLNHIHRCNRQYAKVIKPAHYWNCIGSQIYWRQRVESRHYKQENSEAFLEIGGAILSDNFSFNDFRFFIHVSAFFPNIHFST